MKKGAWITSVLLAVFLTMSFVVAVNDSTLPAASLSGSQTTPPTQSFGATQFTGAGSDGGAAVDKGYQCLAGLIGNKTSISLQEAVFGILAQGSNKKLEEVVQSNKHATEACWPKTGCKLKETAQVVLAYQRLGKSTKEIESWMLSKKLFPSELLWYLEVDSVQKEVSTCTIKYDGKSYTVNIKEDMTLGGSAGSCLSPSTSGYWLRVSNQCLAKSYEISCDKDFVTTFLYQKDASDTVYVSSSAHAAPSLGTTNESIAVSCLGSGNACDYEGSLWSALALQKVNKDVSTITPYLLALSDDNQKYFSSAFLSILTSDPEQYNILLQSRKQNAYWEFSGGNGRWYDTGLGLWALSGSSQDAEATKAYLLGIQQSNGCWNNDNLRDTAFILYAGWSREIAKSAGAAESSTSCAEANLFCQLPGECSEAQGSVQPGYECPGVQICCSQKLQLKTCANDNGKLCGLEQTCNGQLFKASDGDCCLGACENTEVQQTKCETNTAGTCRSSCNSGEQSVSDTCSSNEVCCVEQESAGLPWFWIILLIILIALLVVAMLYRDALRMWFFKRKGKASSAPIIRPSVPPSSPPSSTFTRPTAFQNRMRAPVRQAPQHRQDTSDMDETLRKLREMSK